MYICDYKSKDGHKMYHGKCIHCGKEFDRRKLWFLKHLNISPNCAHMSHIGNLSVDTEQILDSRLRVIFSHMCERCYNDTRRDYRWYGAKGIKICSQWLNNPSEFEKWALENGYQDNLTIDRKDDNSDYCPDNCQWITLEANAKYKSSTNIYLVDGEYHTGQEWSKELNLGQNTINTYFRNYPEEVVYEFIRRRKANPNLYRASKQTWLSVYGLE